MLLLLFESGDFLVFVDGGTMGEGGAVVFVVVVVVSTIATSSLATAAAFDGSFGFW